MAQSGVLWVPRIQLIRGFVHTMTMTDLSIGGGQTAAQVSFTAGRSGRWKLIPADLRIDPSALRPRHAGACRHPRLLRAASKEPMPASAGMTGWVSPKSQSFG